MKKLFLSVGALAFSLTALAKNPEACNVRNISKGTGLTASRIQEVFSSISNPEKRKEISDFYGIPEVTLNSFHEFAVKNRWVNATPSTPLTNNELTTDVEKVVTYFYSKKVITKQTLVTAGSVITKKTDVIAGYELNEQIDGLCQGMDKAIKDKINNVPHFEAEMVNSQS